jgi:DNA polymerase
VSTALADLHAEIAGCVRCPLAAGRTTVVVGSGPPDARLMLVGEAPGFHEDRSGVPFVGAAGQLLDRLLGEVGLQRSEVFVANVLKCRPPGNRDPEPQEIERCRPYLERQVELVAPLVIGSLGNFATRLLSGRQVGITRVHGSPLRITVGAHRTVLYPLYHPAAALRTPAMLAALRDDLARLPELFERAARAAARAAEGAEEPPAEPARVYAGSLPGAQPAQLGLF